MADRIFGTIKGIAPIFWIVNFSIYKAHLMVTDGYTGDLHMVLRDISNMYISEYDCLEVLEFT